MHKIEGLLGLANRSRKLVSGEKIWSAISSKQAKLVVMGKDTGANTKKKILDKCAFYQVEVMLVDSSQVISNAMNANRKVVAVCDKGFADALRNMKG